MRIVFLGTPEFAVPSLEALVNRGHDVVGVFTQPDRPKGRGGVVAESPVKIAAGRLGIPIHQPERIRRPESVEILRRLTPEMMVVVGYGQIIPQALIDLPAHGVLNVQASLLPKYRGAAPIQWAIANGETETGVTIMQIDAGLDTGDILLQRSTPIGPDETAPELAARLAPLGAELMIDTLRGLEAGTIQPRAQDHAHATLAPILKKEDGRIDFHRTATEIWNRLRGFQPWPGAYTTFRGKSLHLWAARPVAMDVPTATIRMEGHLPLAGCAPGTALELIEVQLEGKKRMAGRDFVNGYRPYNGESLGEQPPIAP